MARSFERDEQSQMEDFIFFIIENIAHLLTNGNIPVMETFVGYFL